MAAFLIFGATGEAFAKDNGLAVNDAGRCVETCRYDGLREITSDSETCLRLQK